MMTAEGKVYKCRNNSYKADIGYNGDPATFMHMCRPGPT